MDNSVNKRVLVISNNVFSTQSNNGKTLSSLFRKVSVDNLAQLFFSSERPEKDLAYSYYRISDADVVRFFFSKKAKVGGCLRYEPAEGNRKGDKNIDPGSLKNYEVARLARECFWQAAPWNNKELETWTQGFSPEIIFFCAGDSLFAYEIFQKVAKLAPDAKRVVYVTDDYILPRLKASPFWWIRRWLVVRAMRKTVADAHVFVTISKEMRTEYLKRLGKDSINVFNISENLKIESFVKTPREDIILIYAGGLHFNRWKVLRKLGLALRKFNVANGRSVKLKIFSQKCSDRIINHMQIAGASEFCGALDAPGVRFELNDADVLVHVESFSRNCIESTRLSISTKLAEYVNIGSNILAVGPGKVSSMRFLRGRATCITSLSNMDNELAVFLMNPEKGSVNTDKADLENLRADFERAVFANS